MTSEFEHPATVTFAQSTLLGYRVDLLPGGDPVDYAEHLGDRIRAGVGGQVVTFNPEMAMLGQRDPQFSHVLHQATWVVPDGAGVVWALRFQGLGVERCPGIELAEALLEQADRQGWKVALIGGKPEVAQAATKNWQAIFPGLTILSFDGYFNAEREAEILSTLHREQPQLVLVGLGSPRQELWIQQYRTSLPAALWMGVGGSFDIWGGVKARAPQWWRDRHLEWLYRLYQEPWRWKRMLALPQFAWQVLIQSGQSSHPSHQ